MKNYQLTVYVSDKPVNVFIQDGFFKLDGCATSFHDHIYTELHCIECGSVEYFVDDRKITSEANSMLIIPPNTFHCCTQKTGDTRMCVFQVNIPINNTLNRQIPRGIISELLHEIERFSIFENATKLSSYIALICSYVTTDNFKMPNIKDREFLIHEFFANNYDKHVTLSELATCMNLSEKQTQRMIEKYTGGSFRHELARRRIEAADHLIKTEGISLSKAAQRVGYSSYNGFWKAYRAFTKE